MCHSDRERTSFDIACLNPRLPEGIWLNPAEVLATRFVLFNQGILIRRDVLDRIGVFDSRLWFLEDLELSSRLALEGPWAFIAEPMVIWRESTTGSLYQTSQKEELRWRKPMVQILEQQLVRAEGIGRESLRKLLRRELKRARRQLKAAQMSYEHVFGVSTLGRLLQASERCRRALFRRSRSFPKMTVESMLENTPTTSDIMSVPMALGSL
jgi:GT2 family glycosyltransferase